MLKVKTIPVILCIASKIDITPIIEAVKKINDFKPTNDKAEAAKQIKEHKTELGFAVIGALIPQLGAISGDVVELIASYEGISQEEAGELDAIAEIKKLAADTGVVNFFVSALQRSGNKQK